MGFLSRIFKKKVSAPIQVIPNGVKLALNEKCDFAINWVLQDEGGLSNDAFDSGGITKFGIIVDDLIRMGHPDAGDQNIKDLTVNDARYIYKVLYWDKLNLDAIKSKEVCCALFDIGVVRGVGIPPKYCIQLFNSNSPEVINAIEPKVFIEKFSELCKIGFQQIIDKNPTQKRFLNGWINRANRLKVLVQAV